MGKKNEEAAPKVKKKGNAPKSTTLKVSKRVKMMAAFEQMRGGSKRQTIMMLGEAEDNFKKNGRLILA